MQYLPAYAAFVTVCSQMGQELVLSDIVLHAEYKIATVFTPGIKLTSIASTFECDSNAIARA